MKKLIYTLGLITLCLFSFLLLQVDFQRFRKAECAFCNPEILDAQTFYRGDGALGILTYKPAVPGHVLIIPKRHVERFEDLTSEEILAIGETVKKVDRRVRGAFGNTDYLLLQKNGRGVGQSVPHVHFHYLPAAKFLIARFFISPWLKPLNQEELKCLKKTFSESP